MAARLIHGAVIERISVLLLFAVTMQSCFYFRQKDAHPVAKQENVSIYSPAKAHLFDGGVIVYRDGFWIRDSAIVGVGYRYSLGRDRAVPVTRIALDSVAALEYFTDEADMLPTLAAAPGTALVLTVGISLLAILLFGSCPTIYTDDGMATHLESEAFSYSIAPRFEADDLDRLDSGAVVDGTYRLHVTNEAAETHYINRLQLVTADHPIGTAAFPGCEEDVVLFGQAAPILAARSSDGRDVRALLASPDGSVFRTDPAVARGLARSVTRDWVELTVRVPEGAQSMVVALRMRNTLFNTVLLYDVMLAGQGPKAVDWLGSETNNLLYAWSFYRWYTSQFGMHITVRDGDGYDEVARIGDAGPIAWRSVAARIDAPRAGIAQLRLEFLPDNWMIDWAGVSFTDGADIEQSVVPPARIDCGGRADGRRIAELVAKDDDRYLVTVPGDRLTFEYHPGAVPAGMTRSYFVGTRGYYIEWLRSAWLKQWRASAREYPFTLSDASITRAARLWQEKKAGFERQFFGTRFEGKAGVR